jgi:rare lipoprotein A
MKIQNLLMLCAALLLTACGTSPHKSGSHSPVSSSGGGYLPGDGPGSEEPARLAATPNAVPRDEPLHRYANRPYDAVGVHYVPLTAPGSYKERGMASWYGKKFHGQRTSSGEVYNMYGMSAAHKTLPIPSYARVTNLRNGKSVIVRVNDRGPFLHDRIMDLSYAAAYKLDIVASGSGEVEVESILPGQAVPETQPAPTVQPMVAEPVHVEPLKPEPAPPAPVPIATIVPVAAALHQDVPPPAHVGMEQTASEPDGRIFLQLGSFHSPQGAESFVASMREKLGELGKRVMVFTQNGLTHVHLGPYRTAEEARASADQLAPRLGFKPFVSAH